MKQDDALDTLYQDYADMIYRLAFLRTQSQADAEDIVQEVFLRYLKTRPVWNDAEHCKAWLLRVTLNCSKSLVTSAWQRHRTEPAYQEQAVWPEEPSEVYQAVAQLPLKYRTVVHLFYYEDYGIREIAELLQSGEATVKSQLFRARKMLQRQLKGEFADV